MATSKNRKDRHHFLPQFYLRGFTFDGGERGRLFGFDRERSKVLSLNPQKLAHIRRFYEVSQPDGVHPDFVEDRLGDPIESKCSRAVQDVVRATGTITPETAIELATLVALLAVRVPYARRQRAAFDDRRSKERLRQQLSTVEGYARFVRTAMMKFVAEGRGPTLQEQAILADRNGLQRYVESDNYAITLDQTSHVQWMLEDFIALTFLLGQREWSGIRTDDSVPDLITSDVPVSVTHLDFMRKPTHPQLESPDSIVLLPLFRRVLLCGTVGPPKPIVEDLTGLVRRVNGYTLVRATWAFAANDRFEWMNLSGCVQDSPSWLTGSDPQDFGSGPDSVVMKWGDEHARLAAS